MKDEYTPKRQNVVECRMLYSSSVLRRQRGSLCFVDYLY